MSHFYIENPRILPSNCQILFGVNPRLKYLLMLIMFFNGGVFKMIVLFFFSNISLFRSGGNSQENNPFPMIKSHPMKSSSHKKHWLLSNSVVDDLPIIDDSYPMWLSAIDRQFLHTTPMDGVRADVMVVKNGTNVFMTISDAVKVAVSNRNNQYVKLWLFPKLEHTTNCCFQRQHHSSQS